MVVAQAVAAISLGLLGASGISKLTNPAPTTGAMRAARLPAARSVSYAIGILEIVTATVAIAFGGLFLLVATTLYLAFAVFTFAAVRNRIPIQSCGCFGREDTPPNVIHVVYNVGAAVAIAVTAGMGLVPVDWSLPTVQLALYLGFGAMGVVASYLLLSRLPRLLAIGSSA